MRSCDALHPQPGRDATREDLDAGRVVRDATADGVQATNHGSRVSLRQIAEISCIRHHGVALPSHLAFMWLAICSNATCRWEYGSSYGEIAEASATAHFIASLYDGGTHPVHVVELPAGDRIAGPVPASREDSQCG